VSRELQDRAVFARNMAAEIRVMLQAESRTYAHAPEMARLAFIVAELANTVRDLADLVDRERGARQ
jgi:hypothetical protein